MAQSEIDPTGGDEVEEIEPDEETCLVPGYGCFSFRRKDCSTVLHARMRSGVQATSVKSLRLGFLKVWLSRSLEKVGTLSL